MKLKIKEAGERTAFITPQSGETVTTDYRSEEELRKIKDNADIKGIKTATGKKIKESLVTDSTGQELSVGDVIEVRGKKFTLQEGKNGVCLALEGRCVMDVKNPRSRTIFENSKKVVRESFEPSSPTEPVLSVGHVDDEPGMLKQTVYDIIKYGTDLYKMLQAYEGMNTHVDFPHWWQSKVTKARDYISMASHYLEYESNEDRIGSVLSGIELEENSPQPSKPDQAPQPDTKPGKAPEPERRRRINPRPGTKPAPKAIKENKPLPSKPDQAPQPGTKPGTAPEPDRRRRINPRPGTKPAPKALKENDIIKKIITRYNREK